jgi:hypothetical protein
MPRSVKMLSPPSAKKVMIAKAMRQARKATWRRSDGAIPCVSEMKIGARPGGSSVTSKVASAEAKKSWIIERPCFRLNRCGNPSRCFFA